MVKEVTVISNYYPPETGAASNRMFELAQALATNNYKVTMICPLPAYPFGRIFSGYRSKFIHKEVNSNLTVYRLWHLPSKSKSKMVRLFSILSFCFSLFWFLLLKKLAPLVLVQLSPLPVGFTAVFIARLKRRKIVLNVSDLWPLAGLQMGLLSKGYYYRILEKTARFCYKKAVLITGQSAEILDHIKTIVPAKKMFLYRNLPQKQASKNRPLQRPAQELKLVYAGLLGVAQGILELIQNFTLPMGMSLSIYGDGPEAKEIEHYASKHPQIHFYGSLERSRLHQILPDYDLALVPLKNRLYGSVPSKIFELSQLGLPMVYLSGGEGAAIIEQYGLGFVIRENYIENLRQLLDDILAKKIKLPATSYIQAIAENNFSFEKQFSSFLLVLEAI